VVKEILETVKIANAPCSWGILAFDLEGQMDATIAARMTLPGRREVTRSRM
jgi:hypothetical protein